MKSFGRDTQLPPPPPLDWQIRLNSALGLIRQSVTDPGLLGRLAQVESALWTANADRERLEFTLGQLQPTRAARELKSALRRNFEDPSSANESLARSLQRRHEEINAVQDRIEQLERSVDASIADIESLAASSTSLALAPANARSADQQELIRRLDEDLQILGEVHDELADT